MQVIKGTFLPLFKPLKLWLGFPGSGSYQANFQIIVSNIRLEVVFLFQLLVVVVCFPLHKFPLLPS